MQLTREVRFALTAEAPHPPVTNSWGGWPASVGLAPFVLLRITVTGEVNARTGYLCNITVIDRAVRDRVIPHVHAAWQANPSGLSCSRLLGEIAGKLETEVPPGVVLSAVELRTTPYLSYRLDLEDAHMVSITQSFEFAAAHRLYCRDMTDAENQATFGKCTNPNGHGHNYTVEVTVAGEPDAGSGVVIEVGELESTVKSRVIDVFDHKHLNDDCTEFAEINPSVENITRVIWNKLEDQFAPARLARVRVYETPKTWAELTS
ncbi:MAG: 6-carboxytetrahydropterin synthase [Phycisphaerales bacterium]|nr:6-carboxytetrahydropterin synthase [Phycisphaerales bacterium]